MAPSHLPQPKEGQGRVPIPLSAEGPQLHCSETAVPDEPHSREKQACQTGREGEREGKGRGQSSLHYQLEDRVNTTPVINTLHPQSIESLMGVQLSDDIGEWVMDGVLVCQLVNHLHPGMITTIHTPAEGQV